MGKRKAVAPPTTSFKKGADIYTEAPLEKETRIAADVRALPEHQEAMQYLTTHSLEYLLDPDPSDQLPVYTKAVRSFYRTLTEVQGEEHESMTDDPKSYSVTIEQQVIQFSTTDLCELIGFPREFVPNTGFERSTVPFMADIIMALTTETYSGQCFVTRSQLPKYMRLIDTVVKKNLIPIGHDQERRGPFLEVLYAMLKNEWFDVGEVFVEQMLLVKSRLENQSNQFLLFPRLITRLLQKHEITLREKLAVDFPMDTFSMSSWNLSRSHMDRIALRMRGVSGSSHGSSGAPTLIERFEILGTELRTVAEEQASLRAYVMNGFEDVRTELTLLRASQEALIVFLGCPPPDVSPPP
ncbi:uncharacterized protein LOC120009907 [Tripterygium wilfordii]|uniref:uncharacterized protein LOC120009907 n=1 Tax=Tripterygium wilfordii TaxID=458696 RepID=UPI0018F8433E|nr:uncharacterized protein LOC120009907 [Tripterygium wilfordii]